MNMKPALDQQTKFYQKIQNIAIEPYIKVGDTELKDVASFAYLESTITRNCTIDSEVDAGIAKASTALND